MPTQDVTDEQILGVRRAAGLASRDETLGLVARLNDAEWSAALDLVDRWSLVAGKFAVLDDKIKLNPADKRAAIRGEMRNLLGLPPVASDGGAFGHCGTGTVSVPTRPGW